MGFADYLGERSCFDSCDEYATFDTELRKTEDEAFQSVQAAAKLSPVATEKAQRAAQEVLTNIWMDRQELEPLIVSCDKAACAVVAFCASRTVTTS